MVNASSNRIKIFPEIKKCYLWRALLVKAMASNKNSLIKVTGRQMTSQMHYSKSWGRSPNLNIQNPNTFPNHHWQDKNFFLSTNIEKKRVLYYVPETKMCVVHNSHKKIYITIISTWTNCTKTRRKMLFIWQFYWMCFSMLLLNKPGITNHLASKFSISWVHF